jgi:SAM-dependent methyltransferase
MSLPSHQLGNHAAANAGGLETVDCPFCKGAQYTVVTGLVPDEESEHLDEPFRSMRFQMVECQECGLTYQRVRPTQAEIWRFYQGEYCCYQPIDQRGLIVRALVGLTVRLQIRTLRRLFPRGSDVLLDYGCGIGGWLASLEQAGVPWRLVGTEISADLVERARAQGVEAHLCDDTTLLDRFAPSSVGIVYMNHVIEHAPDPLRLLRTIHDVLVPGGILLGQTPNCDCLERRLFGDLWPQWHFPRHLVVFSDRTIRTHAERAGFEVVAVRPSVSGATQWAGSTLKVLARLRGRRFRSINEPLYPFVLLALAPFAFVQSLVANTSHMDFVFRKPEHG